MFVRVLKRFCAAPSLVRRVRLRGTRDARGVSRGKQHTTVRAAAQDEWPGNWPSLAGTTVGW